METNHFAVIRDRQLRQELPRLLYEQQQKVTQIAFLAPDVDDVFRVHANACRLLANETLRTRLEATFGPTTRHVVFLTAVLSKIGFADPALATLEIENFYLDAALARLRTTLSAAAGQHLAAIAAQTDELARRHEYGMGEIKHWLAVFAYRFFQISQFQRTCVPNAPKVGSGGSLSPRGDYRAPSDSEAAVWLEQLQLLPEAEESRDIQRQSRLENQAL